jgi:hypothetical protein
MGTFKLVNVDMAIYLISKKIKRRLLLIILFLITFLSLSLADWEKTYGFPWAHDLGAYVIETPDKGYLITGRTDSIGTGTEDIYLFKTDSIGNLLWERIYGGTEDDLGKCILPVGDSVYYIGGVTRSFGAGNWDWWLLKIDSGGDTLWTKTYGSTNYDMFTDADVCQDGIVLVGWTGYGTFDAGACILKVDFEGDTIWAKEYGGASADCCYGVKATQDNGSIITGYTSSFGTGVEDIYNLRVNTYGDTLWTRTFGGFMEDVGYSVVQSPDGGFAITGYTNSFGPTSEDVILLKLDAYGNTLWFRTYGTIETEIGYSVSTTSDRGFIIVGFRSSASTDDDIWLIKTDEFGDTLWTRTFGGAFRERAWCVKQTSDGGFILVGQTYSFSASRDVYLIKTDSLGYTQIEETYSTRPKELSLEVYPNPFNSSITISLDFGSESRSVEQIGSGTAAALMGAEIEIFDVTGRIVAVIPVGDGSPVPSASGRGDLAPTKTIWQPDENIGSGVYLIRVKLASQTLSKRVVYLK